MQLTIGPRMAPVAPLLAGIWIVFAQFALVLSVFPAINTDASSLSYGHSSAPLFESARVLPLELEIAPDGLASLRKDRRRPVTGWVRQGTTIYSNVFIHLKGTRGSVRSIDDKPSFTLQFAAGSPAHQFYGLRKIHLNNAVEDPTYLNQGLGSHLFHTAGIATPRTTYASVRLGSRRLGIYVLQEGLTEEYVADRYPGAGVLLFEPGRGQDVDQVLVPKWENSEAWATFFARLDQALRADPVSERWNQLSEIVDLDQFVTFMAMEIILGHRDGYCLARNNFRLALDRARGRFFWVPYGMDQLLGNPKAVLVPSMAGRLAEAVMRTPEGQARYRRKCEQLVAEVFQPGPIATWIQNQARVLEPWLSWRELSSFRREVADLEQRVYDRRAFLDRQLAEPELRPVSWREGETLLENWTPRDVPDGGKLDRPQVEDGLSVLRVVAGSRTAASWRSKVLLSAGHYRFQGRVRTSGVEPLLFGARNGAALRVADLTLERIPTVLGDSPWTPLEVTFRVVGEPRVFEMVCELRARRGEAWFDLRTLRLVKLPDY
ncbi:MAG: CotH kinase family protein [Verrucomicrobiales bacterium]|nr:CotH kinase family protein [Verrucomicrobiales bacterium]